MPEQAKTVALLFLAEQLERQERKRAFAAERQARYRNAHSNADNDVTNVLFDRHNNAAVTPSRVDNKLLPSKQESKKEKEVSLSVNASSSKPLDPEGFPDFWAIYPKRHGDADRKGAIKAYIAASRRAPFETILQGAMRYSQFCDADGKTRTEFVKQARTWLNADGWNEAYEPKPLMDDAEARRLAAVAKIEKHNAEVLAERQRLAANGGTHA